MSTTSLKSVNEKLRNLPEAMLSEVDYFIDFLTYKHEKEGTEIPQWQKEEVLKRQKENSPTTDAFEMLHNLNG